MTILNSSRAFDKFPATRQEANQNQTRHQRDCVVKMVLQTEFGSQFSTENFADLLAINCGGR